MDTPKAIIISAVIISISIFLASGIYEFSSPNAAITHRYNKITGSIDFCIMGEGCVSSSEVD